MFHCSHPVDGCDSSIFTEPAVGVEATADEALHFPETKISWSTYITFHIIYDNDKGIPCKYELYTEQNWKSAWLRGTELTQHPNCWATGAWPQAQVMEKHLQLDTTKFQTSPLPTRINCISGELLLVSLEAQETLIGSVSTLTSLGTNELAENLIKVDRDAV